MWTCLVIALSLPFICYTFQVNSIDPIAADLSLVRFEYTLIVIKEVHTQENFVQKSFYGTLFCRVQ